MKKLKMLGTLVAGYALTSSVYAASILPGTFGDDMNAVKTDLTTMIGGLVGILVVILGWRYFKKGAN